MSSKSSTRTLPKKRFDVDNMADNPKSLTLSELEARFPILYSGEVEALGFRLSDAPKLIALGECKYFFKRGIKITRVA